MGLLVLNIEGQYTFCVSPFNEQICVAYLKTFNKALNSQRWLGRIKLPGNLTTSSNSSNSSMSIQNASWSRLTMLAPNKCSKFGCPFVDILPKIQNLSNFCRISLEMWDSFLPKKNWLIFVTCCWPTRSKLPLGPVLLPHWM